MDWKIFGKRIKELRITKGITQKNMADSLSISPCYLSMIEQGLRQANLELLMAISQEMDVSLEYLLEG